MEPTDLSATRSRVASNINVCLGMQGKEKPRSCLVSKGMIFLDPFVVIEER